MHSLQCHPPLLTPKKKYPKLLVVTHTLSNVKPTDEPEADYNESLADFGHELITALDSSSFGKTDFSFALVGASCSNPFP